MNDTDNGSGPAALPEKKPQKVTKKKRGRGRPKKDVSIKSVVLTVTLTPLQLLGVRMRALSEKRPISQVVQDALTKEGIAA